MLQPQTCYKVERENVRDVILMLIVKYNVFNVIKYVKIGFMLWDVAMKLSVSSTTYLQHYQLSFFQLFLRQEALLNNLGVSFCCVTSCYCDSSSNSVQLHTDTEAHTNIIDSSNIMGTVINKELAKFKLDIISSIKVSSLKSLMLQ